MLPLDLGWAAARTQARFELLQLFDQAAHVRYARDFVCGGCGFGDYTHVSVIVARIARRARSRQPNGTCGACPVNTSA
jgi:hypothetical protein